MGMLLPLIVVGIVGFGVVAFRSFGLLSIDWPDMSARTRLVRAACGVVSIAAIVYLIGVASDIEGDAVGSADEVIALAQRPADQDTIIHLHDSDASPHRGGRYANRTVLSGIYGHNWANEPTCVPAGPRARICRDGNERLIIHHPAT